MKKLLIIFLILTAFCLTAAAQTANIKRPDLPANLMKYAGEYPDKLMKVAAVKTRLKILLGKKYSTFDSDLSVQSPVKKVGDFLFASGCLPHSCTISEAAFAIDLKNKRIHAVIYNNYKAPQFFNEDSAATPDVILDWIKEFTSN